MIDMSNKTIGNVCQLLNGYSFKSNQYVEDGIRVIRIANVQKGYIEDNTPAFYPLSSKGLDNYMLEEGDLLISLTGNVGRVALLGSEMLPAALNQRVACLRLKDNSIDKKFLFHYLNSSNFENKCIQESKGVAQKNMSTEWLKRQEIPSFTYKEQKKISSILDRISNIIKSKTRQLTEYDQLIKSRFVEMFGNLIDTVRLGDCCKVHARIGWQALTTAEHMQTGDYLLITGTDFKDNEVNYSTCKYVAKERYEMDDKIIIRNDDILITKDGTIGKVAIVHNLPKPATLNSGIFVVRPDQRFNKEYISYVFRGPLFDEFVEKTKTGATIKHLNQGHLVNFLIPLPSIEEQISFANFSIQIDKLKFAALKGQYILFTFNLFSLYFNLGVIL
jgi:type I restriction enzyme S subunit